MGCTIREYKNSFYVEVCSVYIRRAHQSFTDRADAEEFLARKKEEIARARDAANSSKRAAEDIEPLWEPTPNLERCGCCELPVSDPHITRRPTGRNGKMQSWAICDSCFAEFECAAKPDEIQNGCTGERGAENVA